MLTQLDGVSSAAHVSSDYYASQGAQNESLFLTSDNDHAVHAQHKLLSDSFLTGSDTAGGAYGQAYAGAAHGSVGEILGNFSLHKPGSVEAAEQSLWGSSDGLSAFQGDRWAASSPAMGFESFSNLPDYAKFQTADCRFDQSLGADGTKEISYTAKDFSTCKIERNHEGGCKLTVSDSIGRPVLSEQVGAAGESALTRMTYHDADGRFSPWLKSTDTLKSDGTRTVLNYRA